MRTAKEILTVEDNKSVLNERSDEIDVTTENDLRKEIISSLKETMRKNNLKSLSAPAIGYKKRIFCVDFGIEIKTFINPMPMKYDTEAQVSIETCSSIPGRRFLRLRSSSVEMVYQRPTGAMEQKEFKGYAAVVIQHELEHLEGILISDFGLELDDNWEKLSKKDKSEIFAEYLDSLDLLSENINKEILENEETKQLSDGIDFMTKVAKGEVKIDHT